MRGENGMRRACWKGTRTVISVFGVSIVRSKWSMLDDDMRGCRLNALAKGTCRKKLMDGGDMTCKTSRERDRSVRDDDDMRRMGWGDL